MKEIQLDINDVRTPIEVTYSKISSYIVNGSHSHGIQVPKELQKFVNKNDPDAGWDWDERLMR